MTFERLKRYRTYKKLLQKPDDLPLELKGLLKIECEKIENYIKAIDDIEIKFIAEKYFLENKTFEQIGRVMNYDRRTVSRKLECWLKVAHNARK